MKLFARYGWIFLFGLMLTACSGVNQSLIKEEFEKSAKGYNRMLRWQEMEAAGMVFIDHDQREIFTKAVAQLKKKGVTIADYRILNMDCKPDKGNGEVITEFDYYIMPSNRLKTVLYRQQWAYREIDGDKSWKVKSPLPGFE